MTNGTPPPIWPTEPTTLYVVLYFETNALGQQPTIADPVLYTFNQAMDKSKEYITNAGNAGVCAIQPITATIVYPSIPWEDF